MSGITTPDSSGNSNDGNLLTGAYLNNGTTNTGLWNTNAGVFDGVSGDINVPNFSKTIYAASFWVKPSSTITSSTDGKILLSFNVASEGDYISFGDSTGYCTNEILSVISGGSKRTCVTSATIPSINTSWHHIAISWDGSKYLIYYDGQNVATTIGTASGNSNLISSSFLNIASFGGTSNFFSGSIEDVAVWNRALSATEVTNIYKKGVARLKLQARSCAQSNCGDSNFSGTDRNVSNYFTDFNNPIDLNMFSNSRYFQYKATFETDDTNMGKGTTSMLLDVNIDYNTLNRVPDVNVVKIGGYLMTQGLPSFSYARDGNLVVDYNVFDADGGVQRIDLNYSLSRAQGTGTSIVQDFNLTSSNCARTDWNTLAVDCNYSFSLSGITDGNYFILAKITDDGNSTAFKASDLNFMIDNTKPIMSWDGNTGWQKPDQNIHLTCSDVNGSGCNTTTYRLDTNPASTISWGVWQTYSGSIPITTDGNYGVDFNATDNAGNAGDVNEVFVLVGPHGRLHTFNSSGKPRSFFSTDQNVTLRIDTNMSFVPTIKIIDSNGTTVLSAGSMTLSGTATDYNSFDYNYTLNGTSGWYDAIIGAQYFSKVFYQGEVWTNRHTDSNGNIFPFSFDLNITEPNNIQHYPALVHANRH
ncbi:MAG: LamG domain-containing protein [Candidatus Diapherotrites archaeon]|nr:LamG domain-containing protein [Candidatus Diapherotrites archaeon]